MVREFVEGRGCHMQTVFEQLTILYIFLLAGWLIGKWKKDKASHADILSVLLVNILLPCKIFSTFARSVTPAYLSEHWRLLVAAMILLAVMACLSLFLPRLLTKNSYERRVYAYSIPITNYGYLGYALIGSVFGESVLARFMLFVIPFSFYTYTVGYILLVGGTLGKGTLKKLVNPIILSVIFGVAFGLSGLELPTVASSAISMASSCVGPLSMLLTGITLSTFVMKELLSDKTAYIFSFLRLVGFPALAYGVCRLANLDAILPMVLIATCMPCGLNPIVFPRLIGEDCKPGARLALLTHALSMVTLPFWLSLIL